MDNKQRAKKIRRNTLVGSVVNFILTSAKIFAGVVGNSSAMIADGIHSLSDFFTDIVVIAFVNVSSKERDHNHHYGHGKHETFATTVISFTLLLVGFGILINGAGKIFSSIRGQILEKPANIALYAAIISIIIKEALFWYTKIEGKKMQSQAMIANAWHHRSDAFSSIGTAVGISGAIVLGEAWRILDPIAGVVVSFFIIKVAWDIGKPSIDELLDASLPETTENEIKNIINSNPVTKGFHNLRTRKIGSNISIEVHVEVDGLLTVNSSHKTATEIETSIRERFGKHTHIIIHIEPFRPKKQPLQN